MIYGTNRTASLGNITIDVNESYFGAGAFSFMEESAQDELAIFESAIKTDIDEALISESSELTALNEGFVQTAVDKIKELMKKFMEWLEAVSRSAIAKLSQLLVRDNAKFCKIARKQILKMKNMKNFKYSGKYLKDVTAKVDSGIDLNNLESMSVKDTISDSELDKLKEIRDAANKMSVSDFMDKCIDTTENGDLNLVIKHLDLLETLDKKQLKDIKDQTKKAKSHASKIVKKATDLQNKLKDDASEEDKKNAANKVEAARIYKEVVQKMVTFELSTTKAIAKICRSVVAKAMGASPKNEGFDYDEELADAMNEAVLLEYDDALEEMSNCKESEDFEDDEDSDDDE